VTRALSTLTAADLRAITDAARSGALTRPYSSVAIGRLLGSHRAQDAALELEALGLDPPQLGIALGLLARERSALVSHADRVELVWTGPEVQGSGSRDTGVVLRELFSSAESSVLVSGFVVYQGRSIFEALARRMTERSELRVQLFLNIPREFGDARPEAILVKEFKDSFASSQWPGSRLPELFYDPRALSQVREGRTSLHAKCVVIDDRRAFVTSANLTEAGQERNIEAGVLLDDVTFARSLRSQFDTLVDVGDLRPAE